MITVGFKFVDEFNNAHTAESTVEVFPDLGESDLDIIGRQLNAFLIQVGFVRHRDTIFMEDVTDEEYDFLAQAIEDYRESKNAPAENEEE